MIPYGHQAIDESDIEAVAEVLRGEWLTTGPYVKEFERLLAEAAGVGSAVSVTSGTAALHCAYHALGIGPGDEVITTPMTFVATQATAAQLGATVKFVDVLPGTALIDPAEVRRAATGRTRAIVAVDYAGQPSDADELRKIANDCGAFLVQDSAHSLGSSLRGSPVGSLADLTTFSFFPTKNITTGEGGAVVGPHPELVERARSFANHGLVRAPDDQEWPDEGAWHQEVHSWGLNYRLSDINAALGISQLRRLATFRKRRQQIVDRYNSAFQQVEGLETLEESLASEVFWHLYPLRVPAVRRREIFDKLRSQGIGVQVNYLPAHLHPVFRAGGHDWGDFPVAEDFYRREISLPLYVDLTDDQVDGVIAAVVDLVQGGPGGA